MAANELEGGKYWFSGEAIGVFGAKTTTGVKYWLTGTPVHALQTTTGVVGSASGVGAAAGVIRFATTGPGVGSGAAPYWFEGLAVVGIGRDDIVRGGVKYWFEGLPHPMLFGQYIGSGLAAGTGSADAVGNLLLNGVGSADGVGTALGYPPRVRAYAQIFG